MTQDYTLEATEVAESLNAVYENKQINKKDSLSGDYSSDSASYPTCNAVNTALSGKLDDTFTNQKGKNVVVDGTTGEITFENKPDIPTNTSDLVNDGDGSVGVTYVKSDDSRLTDSRTPTSHTQASTTITNNGAFDNILSGESTTLTLDTQAKINTAINTVIGSIKSSISNLQGLNVINITNDKGTASASTMNKLYIETQNNKTDVYYTVEDDGSYSWEKLEEDILDDVSIDWTDVLNKPDYFTPSSHTHGNISNDGKIGSTSGLPLITTTDGAVTTGSFGSTSGSFAEGNHTHSNYTTASDVEAEIGAFASALAEAINPSSP